MILVIDNYDSFTFNIVQYLEELGAPCKVVRNDAIDCDAIQAMNPQAIVISPGPGNPDEAGITLKVIEEFSGTIPILGVCLGHQSIGQVFGAKVTRGKNMMHGKTSQINHIGDMLFGGIPNPFVATRYHSLIVSDETLPSCLEVTARSNDGVIMAMRHREFKVYGVQFHPESLMTPDGKQILANFLGMIA